MKNTSMDATSKVLITLIAILATILASISIYILVDIIKNKKMDNNLDDNYSVENDIENDVENDFEDDYPSMNNTKRTRENNKNDPIINYYLDKMVNPNHENRGPNGPERLTLLCDQMHSRKNLHELNKFMYQFYKGKNCNRQFLTNEAILISTFLNPKAFFIMSQISDYQEKILGEIISNKNDEFPGIFQIGDYKTGHYIALKIKKLNGNVIVMISDPIDKSKENGIAEKDLEKIINIMLNDKNNKSDKAKEINRYLDEIPEYHKNKSYYVKFMQDIVKNVKNICDPGDNIKIEYDKDRAKQKGVDVCLPFSIYNAFKEFFHGLGINFKDIKKKKTTYREFDTKVNLINYLLLRASIIYGYFQNHILWDLKNIDNSFDEERFQSEIVSETQKLCKKFLDNIYKKDLSKSEFNDELNKFDESLGNIIMNKTRTEINNKPNLAKNNPGFHNYVNGILNMNTKTIVSNVIEAKNTQLPEVVTQIYL